MLHSISLAIKVFPVSASTPSHSVQNSPRHHANEYISMYMDGCVCMMAGAILS